jgi:hypothetical protein
MENYNTKLRKINQMNVEKNPTTRKFKKSTPTLRFKGHPHVYTEKPAHGSVKIVGPGASFCWVLIPFGF